MDSVAVGADVGRAGGVPPSKQYDAVEVECWLRVSWKTLGGNWGNVCYILAKQVLCRPLLIGGER